MASPADPAAELALPGFRLRRARTERGLSLEEIARGSCIPLRALAALEADDYARLPEAVYVRGYVRRYAGMLGIAAQPLIDDLAAHYGGGRGDHGTFARRRDQTPVHLPRAWLLGGGAVVTLILGAVLLIALGRS